MVFSAVVTMPGFCEMGVLSTASAFEILNCTLMLLRRFKRREGAEISAPSRAGIGLPRIEAILA
jgi:hypothetical protein